MDVPGPVRKFLNWERRIFLFEEEWGFPTTRDMTGLIAALDQRFKRLSVSEERTVWSNPLRTLAVHVSGPDRIEVFWGWAWWWWWWLGLVSGLYFDGRLIEASGENAIVGRLRHRAFLEAIHLLFGNLVLLWFVIGGFFVARQAGDCLAGVSDGCAAFAAGGIVLGLGVLVASLLLAFMRYVISGYLFFRRPILGLLNDLAAGGAPD